MRADMGNVGECGFESWFFSRFQDCRGGMFSCVWPPALAGRNQDVRVDARLETGA